MEEDRDFAIDLALRKMYRELVDSGKILEDRISENDFVSIWYNDFNSIYYGD